ncbi:MAG: RNA polymerase sigma factor [Planctomycetota bacterium]|nr:MAG: RNA polymerase sigma factor [Planctomycetota bacterium]
MSSRIKNLCRCVKKGDKDAACELLTIYYQDIFGYFRRLCGSKEDAEDLTQQAFLKVWRSLGSFRGRSSFSTWLYRIAYNTYIDRHRRNRQTKSCTDQWWQQCIDTSPGPFANAAERQMAKRLYTAVEQLDDGKKHLVHLHYYQGLSLRQTAKVLNISTSTVKYRLREVIKLLREQLGVEENGLSQKESIPIAKGEPI